MNLFGLTSTIENSDRYAILVLLLLIYFLFLGDAILLGIWLRRWGGKNKKKRK